MRALLSVILILMGALGLTAQGRSATPTYTPSTTPTFIMSATPTRTPSRTVTSTITLTATRTATGLPAFTATPTASPTATPFSLSYSCSSSTVFGDDEAVTATWYDNTPLGMSACHYSDPTLPAYFAAAATQLYDQDLCGACAEITSKGGAAPGSKLTVMVTDECPAASNPTYCSSGSYHMDLGELAYKALNGGSTGGALPIEWKLVPCPASYLDVKGQYGASLSYQFKSGASPGWPTLIVRDYASPILALEYCTGLGSGCVAAIWQRSYNGWVVSSGTWNTIYLRVTSKNGTVTNHGPITCCSPAGTDSKAETEAVYALVPGGQMGPCAAPSSTLTPTISPTPSITATATITPVSDPLIEDFPNGVSFPSSRAGWFNPLASGAVQDVAGPSCGSSAHAVRLSGIAPQYNGVDLCYAGPYAIPVPTPINYSLVASQTRALSFRIKTTALFMNLMQVQIHSFAGAYGAMVSLTPNAWVNVTIAAPDHEAPGDWPQFSNLTSPDAWGDHISKVTKITFAPRGFVASDEPFDFEIDDLRWGVYPYVSECQVSGAFGASDAVVQEAYGTGVDEFTAWLLIVLSQHCGCSPTQVLAERATRSWGEIAELYGTTWAAVLDEVDLAAGNAGLEPLIGSPEQLLRGLRNGTPSTAPLPTATPYVPAGPQVLPPPAAGGC